MNEISESLIDGIMHLINSQSKTQDKTFTAIIKDIKEDNTYDITTNGIVYSNVPSVISNLQINRAVKVKIPQGQASQMYIESIINMDKSHIGLNKVDNTSDSEKKVLSANKLTKPVFINGELFDGSRDIEVHANMHPIIDGEDLDNIFFKGVYIGSAIEDNILNVPKGVEEFILLVLEYVITSEVGVMFYNSQILFSAENIYSRNNKLGWSKWKKFLTEDDIQPLLERISNLENLRLKEI